MLPPRTPSTPAGRSPTSEASAQDLSIPGSSQLRSRVLGQEEHNVMLALGLVRAATRTLLSLEPAVVRATELIDRLDTPRETAIVRGDLKKVCDGIARALETAVFDRHPLLEGETAVFDVEDSRRNGEPLRVSLPDFSGLIRGEHGLAEFVTRKRSRREADRMAGALRDRLSAGKDSLHEAEQQLSVLLTHFHRQRSEHSRSSDGEADLVRTAADLRDHVIRAGKAALAAQGELSTRASSLVLNERATR